MIQIPYDPAAPELFDEQGNQFPFIRIGDEMIIFTTQEERDNWFNEYEQANSN